MIEIKDVIHLYLGCELVEEGSNSIGEFLGYAKFGDRMMQVFTNCSSNDPYWGSVSQFKPLLRNLSSMTEEEAARLGMLLYTGVIIGNPYKENDLWRVPYGITLADYWQIDGKVFNQHQTVYLLSHYFDIFNLHEQGLCLYKSDLKS